MGTPTHVSDQGIAFLAGWERFRSTIYPDEGGRPTIGYGHLIKPGELFDQPISEDEGRHLLHDDLAGVEIGLSGLLGTVGLEQHQFDALAIFTYNCGLGAFYHSHLCELVRQRLFDSAAAEFERWCHVGGKISNGVLRRRKNEALMFLGKPYEAQA